MLNDIISCNENFKNLDFSSSTYKTKGYLNNSEKLVIDLTSHLAFSIRSIGINFFL